jgi:rhodanese-related sulfurtransferase
MQNLLKTAALATALAGMLSPAAARADHHGTHAAPAPTTTAPVPAAPAPTAPQVAPAAAAAKVITVEALARLLKAQKDAARTLVTVLDVNNAKTRAEAGVIPGAVMLDSSSDYDLGVLGKDQDQALVFYCSSEKCTASKTAAAQAIKAGFKDVSVLPVGIAGWVKAGQAVDKPVG